MLTPSPEHALLPVPQAVRHLALPSHSLAYTGQTAWRTLLPFALVKDIPNLPDASTFFHGPGAHVFTTQVGNGKFEISARAFVPFDGQVTWGVPVGKAEFAKYYEVRGLQRWAGRKCG